jgi:hypothetical protein
MNKDSLFLLKPDFRTADGDGPLYCPDCAMVEGLLSFYPKLRRELAVEYLDFPRPRAALVALLGEANQGCPVLVVADGRRLADPAFPVGEAGGRRFVSGHEAIGRYLSTVYGIGRPA